jgi:hypothetical protein
MRLTLGMTPNEVGRSIHVIPDNLQFKVLVVLL